MYHSILLSGCSFCHVGFVKGLRAAQTVHLRRKSARILVSTFSVQKYSPGNYIFVPVSAGRHFYNFFSASSGPYDFPGKISKIIHTSDLLPIKLFGYWYANFSSLQPGEAFSKLPTIVAKNVYKQSRVIEKRFWAMKFVSTTKLKSIAFLKMWARMPLLQLQFGGIRRVDCYYSYRCEFSLGTMRRFSRNSYRKSSLQEFV